MFESLYGLLDYHLGLSQTSLTIFHMMYRALFVYMSGMLIIILNKRFVGERTSFDLMLKFIIGNTLANGITGNSPFFATLAAVLVMVMLNWCISYVTFHSKLLERIIKGCPIVLFENKKLNWNAMAKVHVTQEDIDLELRKSGLENLTQVKLIVFESTGEITVIANDYQRKVAFAQDDDEL